MQERYELRTFTRGATASEASDDAGTGSGMVRHHIALLDYDRYYGELFRRMSTWDKAKAVVYTTQAALVDDTNQRRLFVSKLNEGGLFLLNEVLVDSSMVRGGGRRCKQRPRGF